MGQGFALGNILYVKLIDLAGDGDFTDENGFFIRSAGGATITYCPINNKTDGESITKTIDSSSVFVDPELCRKIFAVGSPIPDDLYVGYGV
jgi:hypothetical protein